jgi:hypothetical protein
MDLASGYGPGDNCVRPRGGVLHSSYLLYGLDVGYNMVNRLLVGGTAFSSGD